MNTKQFEFIILSILMLSGCESVPRSKDHPQAFLPPQQHYNQNSNPSVVAGKMISPVM